jgi:hypothetical protein
MRRLILPQEPQLHLHDEAGWLRSDGKEQWKDPQKREGVHPSRESQRCQATVRGLQESVSYATQNPDRLTPWSSQNGIKSSRSATHVLFDRMCHKRNNSQYKGRPSSVRAG